MENVDQNNYEEELFAHLLKSPTTIFAN